MSEPFEGERAGAVTPDIASHRHHLDALWATLGNTLRIIKAARIAVADSLDLLKQVDGKQSPADLLECFERTQQIFEKDLDDLLRRRSRPPAPQPPAHLDNASADTTTTSPGTG